MLNFFSSIEPDPRITARVEDDSRLVMECVTGDGKEEEVREFFINDNGYLVQVSCINVPWIGLGDCKYRKTLNWWSASNLL